MEASCTFWEHIGFRQVDGKREENWAIMQNGTTEIGLFKGLGETGSVTLNFRGSDTGKFRSIAETNELPFLNEGKSSPDGSGSFIIRDPAGTPLFFDSTAEERQRYDAGHRLSVGDGNGELREGAPLIGNVTPCFFVDDVAACQTFYQHLGMQRVGGEMKHNWVALSDGWHTISLFGREHQGEFPDFIINFRGGDVQAIADRLKASGLTLDLDANEESDGSMGCVISDPDGFCIYINTDPSERLY